MTDENARCNAAMDGAGPAHSEPHDGAEFRPIERNPDPPAALLHAPVACNLWISSQDLNPVERGGLMRTLIIRGCSSGKSPWDALYPIRARTEPGPTRPNPDMD